MSGQVRSFQDLRTWQHAMDLIPKVYQLVRKLPAEERFALGEQLRRATVSVPANIAEGHARRHTKEFLQHLSIARGSLAELHTLLLVAQRLGYITPAELSDLEKAVDDVGKPLSGLIARLKEKS